MNISKDVKEDVVRLLFDAQTSGGLLICVDATQGENLVTALRDSGVTHAAMIGNIRSDQERILVL